MCIFACKQRKTIIMDTTTILQKAESLTTDEEKLMLLAS